MSLATFGQKLNRLADKVSEIPKLIRDAANHTFAKLERFVDAVRETIGEIARPVLRLCQKVLISIIHTGWVIAWYVFNPVFFFVLCYEFGTEIKSWSYGIIGSSIQILAVLCISAVLILLLIMTVSLFSNRQTAIGSSPNSILGLNKSGVFFLLLNISSVVAIGLYSSFSDYHFRTRLLAVTERPVITMVRFVGNEYDKAFEAPKENESRAIPISAERKAAPPTEKKAQQMLGASAPPLPAPRKDIWLYPKHNVTGEVIGAKANPIGGHLSTWVEFVQLTNERTILHMKCRVWRDEDGYLQNATGMYIVDASGTKFDLLEDHGEYQDWWPVLGKYRTIKPRQQYPFKLDFPKLPNVPLRLDIVHPGFEIFTVELADRPL